MVGKVVAGKGAAATAHVAERRAARQLTTRRKLLDAAARVIGRYGYGGCSVARVTAKARIAHGTFYLYFRSQQDLFDLILPTLGGEMLASIAAAIGNTSDPMEVERRGFAANARYTVGHTYMNRVLSEAQLYAPGAYAEFFDRIIHSYVDSFRRTIKSGSFKDSSDEELARVAAMMVAARESLLFTINSRTIKIPRFVDDLVQTYLAFVQRGLGL